MSAVGAQRSGEGPPVEGVPVESLFADVIGQESAVEALRAAARRPVHAYLFCGPPGTGRRPAARAFAAALLCPRGGCGECDTCRRALAGTHPDLVVVERTGPAVGVDEARRLVGLSQHRPFESTRQVLVVGDVHLAIRSAPALLKTLEEPPSSTVFVLIADDVPPELVTVASRCVTIEFKPIGEDDVARWLVDRGTPPGEAAEVAADCGGDLERARLLAEDPGHAARVALWRSVPDRLDGTGAAAATLARELLAAGEAGLAPLRAQQAAEIERLTEEAKTMGERGLPRRREITDRHHREERQLRTWELRAGLGVLARAYRDRLVDALRVAGSPGGQLTEAAPYERAAAMVSETTATLERNPNERLLLEALFVRLSLL